MDNILLWQLHLYPNFEANCCFTLTFLGFAVLPPLFNLKQPFAPASNSRFYVLLVEKRTIMPSVVIAILLQFFQLRVILHAEFSLHDEFSPHGSNLKLIVDYVYHESD